MTIKLETERVECEIYTDNTDVVRIANMYIPSQFRNQPDNQEYITKAIDEIIRKARSRGLNAIIYESSSEPEDDLIRNELEHKEFLIQSKESGGISGRKVL